MIVLLGSDLRAPEEVPTRTAVGAARPRAHGQATTSTLHASCRLSNRGPAAPPTTPPPYLLITCTHKLLGIQKSQFLSRTACYIV